MDVDVRISIASRLSHSTEVSVLDELTAALRRETGGSVEGEVREEMQATTLFLQLGDDADPDVVREVCDEILSRVSFDEGVEVRLRLGALTFDVQPDRHEDEVAERLVPRADAATWTDEKRRAAAERMRRYWESRKKRKVED